MNSEERIFWTKVWYMLTVVFVALALIIGSVTAYDAYQFRLMVEKGSDPLVLGCAYGYPRMEVCLTKLPCHP